MFICGNSGDLIQNNALSCYDQARFFFFIFYFLFFLFFLREASIDTANYFYILTAKKYSFQNKVIWVPMKMLL